MSKVEEYGAFVSLLDVPNVSGLVHKSELSWDAFMNVDDVIKEGECGSAGISVDTYTPHFTCTHTTALPAKGLKATSSPCTKIWVTRLLCLFLFAGDKLSVKVLDVDPAAGRINFSIKQLQQDPLTQTLDTVGVGTDAAARAA